MKDPVNCPYCEAEEKGYSEGWGFSPEGWDMMWEKHIAERWDKFEIHIEGDKTISNQPNASTDTTYLQDVPYTLTKG